MAFRHFNDVIHYFNGNWQKENALMDEYLENSDKKGQVIIDKYDVDSEDLEDFGNDVYLLGMLCGARFGRSEVLSIIEYLKNNK